MKNTNQKETRTQYLVDFKFRLDPDNWQPVSVTHNSRTNKLMWSIEEAKYEIERMKREEAYKKQRGKTTTTCAGIGFDLPHHSQYDIIAFRIRKREVTPWETEYEETVE